MPVHGHVVGRATYGQVLIQRLEPGLDWLAQEGKTSERGGVAVTFRDVRLEDRLLSAVAEYRISETVWRQAFTSRLLDDEELTAELSAAGLRFARVVDQRRSWVEARPAQQAPIRGEPASAAKMPGDDGEKVMVL